MSNDPVPADAGGLPAITRRSALTSLAGAAAATALPTIAAAAEVDHPWNSWRRIGRELSAALDAHDDGRWYATVYPATIGRDGKGGYAVSLGHIVSAGEDATEVGAAIAAYRSTHADFMASESEVARIREAGSFTAPWGWKTPSTEAHDTLRFVGPFRTEEQANTAFDKRVAELQSARDHYATEIAVGDAASGREVARYNSKIALVEVYRQEALAWIRTEQERRKPLTEAIKRENEACNVMLDAFDIVLDAPCRTLADVQAKAALLLEPHIEREEETVERFLTSIVGATAREAQA